MTPALSGHGARMSCGDIATFRSQAEKPRLATSVGRVAGKRPFCWLVVFGPTGNFVGWHWRTSAAGASRARLLRSGVAPLSCAKCGEIEQALRAQRLLEPGSVGRVGVEDGAIVTKKTAEAGHFDRL
jgi:hypothetical protein